MGYNLNYEVLQGESEKLLKLIQDEQKVLDKSQIALSTYFSETDLNALSNVAYKIGSKMDPGKFAGGAQTVVGLAVANPILGLAGAAIVGTILLADEVKRSKAEEDAKKKLEEAFKYLTVNLEKLDELVNKKMREGIRRGKVQSSEIREINGKIMEIRDFIGKVTY